MSEDNDGQNKYMVQQKVSYHVYEQEQKVLLRARYPFLPPAQISRKVKESWNRLKQEAKQSYTKSVLVKTPTKDVSKVATKQRNKKQKVSSKIKKDPIVYGTLESPNSVSSGYLQSLKNDSVYTSDFYSSPMVLSPNNDNRQDTFCPKLFESPHFESPPHRQVDFNQKDYIKSKLPVKVPKIIQNEHSTQGILKGSRTDDTPKTKAVKGRVSFSTAGDESFQQSKDNNDMDDCHQDNDSDDEYSAMLIRRTDDQYNFDDIDQHSMVVEEENQAIYPMKKPEGEDLNNNKQKSKKSKKKDRSKGQGLCERESPIEIGVNKSTLSPTDLENSTIDKKRKARYVKRQNSHGDEEGKEEKLPEKPKGQQLSRRRGASDEKGGKQSYYNSNRSSQSDDSVKGNSQSSDSFISSSQSYTSAEGNSQLDNNSNIICQSNESLSQDVMSPTQEPKKRKLLSRSRQNSSNSEVTSGTTTKKEARSVLKSRATLKDCDITPEQKGETTYITPQMHEDIYTHNLLEASKLPRKTRRSSQWKEEIPNDDNTDELCKLTKQKRRSSRRLAGDQEENFTEVKKSCVIADKLRKNEANTLLPVVDASGDAKKPENPKKIRKTLRKQTKAVNQPESCNDGDDDEVASKASDISSYDSWTILDEEYNSELALEEDSDHESAAVGQSDASKALVQALRKMKQTMADDGEVSDERSSPKLLSPALSGISQMSSASSDIDSSTNNSQSSRGKGQNVQISVSTGKAVTPSLCEMFGNMTPPEKRRTSQHTRRLLASSNRESTSNFSQLFKSHDIFA